MESQVRQNFHVEVEAGINQQINRELEASYVYQAMANHFDRDDVALAGFNKFFQKSSDEEREHAGKLMKYQTSRGGRVVLADIQRPKVDSWASGLTAMKDALDLEKSINQDLLDLHSLAGSHGDAHFSDVLESEFLGEQVESIKQLSDYVTNLKRVGPGLGEYTFDKETLGQ